jgi:hypothetical protein
VFDPNADWLGRHREARAPVPQAEPLPATASAMADFIEHHHKRILWRHSNRPDRGMIGRVPGSNSWEDSAIGTGG